MKIILVEPIGYSSEEINKIKVDFEALNHECSVYNSKPSNEEEFIQRARNADVLILSNLPTSENVIHQCKNLKMISVAFAGVDHIPMDLCRKRDIIVSNAAGYSNHAVAELTLGSVIALYRKITWGDSQTRKLSTREGFLGSELYGKTFGIIGTGQIGAEVAHLANAFGCKVLAYNRSTRNIPNVEFCNLDYLLEKSDIISLHIPLRKETKNLINDEKLKRVKPSAILINTARGEVLVLKDILEYLKMGKLTGVALDVLENEKLNNLSDEEKAVLSELSGMFNVLFTPHIAGWTFESYKRINEVLASKVAALQL